MNIRKNRISILRLTITFILIVIGSLVCTKTTYASDDFWVRYVDVGQGDCAIIECDGHYMIIDGGPADASSKVYSVLKSSNISNIDFMIATHPDADHVGGLSGALNYAAVKKCYSPVTDHDTKTFQSFLKYLKKQNVSITVPQVSETFNLGSADVQLISPKSSGEINNNSIIVKVTYDSSSFLFMGDAEYEEEQEALSGFDLNCDVLKVGHHGSTSSTSAALLKEATPLAAVISVGKDNSYGHPAQDTLNNLLQDDILIFRTDLQGDITFTAEGSKIYYEVSKDADYDKILTGRDSQTSQNSDSKKTRAINSAKSESASEGVNGSADYVLNTNTKKFHYPSCSSVKDIKSKNREDVNMTREDIISMGYEPCKKCKP